MRIAVIDDDPLVRRMLATALLQFPEIEITWTAPNASEGLKQLQSAELPDLVLLDVNLPDTSGLDLVKRVTQNSEQPKVIMISTLTDTESLKKAFHNGAVGYFAKDDDPALIVELAKKALAGELVFSPTCSRQMVDHLTSVSPKHGPAKAHVPGLSLTKQEKTVLELISDSLTNQQIASELNISLNTVKTHIRHIMEKTGTVDRAGMVTYGFRNGLIS